MKIKKEVVQALEDILRRSQGRSFGLAIYCPEKDEIRGYIDPKDIIQAYQKDGRTSIDELFLYQIREFNKGKSSIYINKKRSFSKEDSYKLLPYFVRGNDESRNEPLQQEIKIVNFIDAPLFLIGFYQNRRPQLLGYDPQNQLTFSKHDNK